MAKDTPPPSKVIRISDDDYKRLQTVSEIKHLSISGANAIAINLFADSIEYSPENLIKRLSQQPSLKIYTESFKEMFKEVDRDTARAVVELLKQGQVYFYECSINELDDAIDKINQQGCKKVVPIIRLNDNIDIPVEIEEKIDESFEKFKKISCKTDEQIFFDKNLGNELVKVAFFLLKKEGENGK